MKLAHQMCLLDRHIQLLQVRDGLRDDEIRVDGALEEILQELLDVLVGGVVQ